MLRNINARIHFFRWVDMQGRRDHTQGEHRALIAAIRARDAATASDLTRIHITRRLDQIVEVMREGYARLYMGERPTVVGLTLPPNSRVGRRLHSYRAPRHSCAGWRSRPDGLVAASVAPTP